MEERETMKGSQPEYLHVHGNVSHFSNPAHQRYNNQINYQYDLYGPFLSFYHFSLNQVCNLQNVPRLIWFAKLFPMICDLFSLYLRVLIGDLLKMMM